jgi:hypothetical protein
MQQFVLEEHLEIMCSECGEEIEDFMSLARDEFISAILRIEIADSSRKWRLLIKMQNWRNWINLSQHTSNIMKIFDSG